MPGAPVFTREELRGVWWFRAMGNELLESRPSHLDLCRWLR